MKVGDKIIQVIPQTSTTRIDGIEATIIEIKEDGIIVEFYHFHEKKMVQQFWPSAREVKLLKENK
jgi:hypothetical protein|tara:strand:+ start:213 stop:407 length:195 start_codon:yes stop_codon:yes gene_type:complete